jgi:hypothetical protein
MDEVEVLSRFPEAPAVRSRVGAPSVSWGLARVRKLRKLETPSLEHHSRTRCRHLAASIQAARIFRICEMS